MKMPKSNILLFSLSLGLFFWVFHAVFDAYVFKVGTFWDRLIFSIPPHDLFYRFSIIAGLFIFGLIASRIVHTYQLTKRALEASERRHHLLFEKAGAAIFLLDAEGDRAGRIVEANPAAAKMHGFTMPELLSLSITDIDTPEAAREAPGRIRRVLSGEWITDEITHRKKDGTVFPVEINAGLIEIDNHKYILAFDRDITEQKQREDELRKSERFLITIFDSIRDPFCIFDRNFRIVRVNEAYAQLKNIPRKNLLGQVCYSVTEKRDRICDACVVQATFHSANPHVKEKHVPVPGRQGNWVEIYTYPVMSDEGIVSHVIEYTRDITDRKKAEEERKHLISELEYLSRTDSLTGLLNRRALIEQLTGAIARAARSGSTLSLILSDIDLFKEINDAHGHAAGDRALQFITHILQESLRKSDTIGRYGGDEFMMILPETSLTGAESLAEKIRNSLSETPFPAGKAGVTLSMSFGVTEFRTADNPDTLIRRSDAALYTAKQAGRNRVSSSEPS